MRTDNSAVPFPGDFCYCLLHMAVICLCVTNGEKDYDGVLSQRRRERKSFLVSSYYDRVLSRSDFQYWQSQANLIQTFEVQRNIQSGQKCLAWVIFG